MSYQIHVYNAIRRKVTVQCYKPDSTEEWGGTVTINPGTSARVYEASMFERGPDLVIAQYDTIVQADSKQRDIKIKETRFGSGRDTSWIVKEGYVVQQEYGKGLDKEDPRGAKAYWTVSADKITLKDVVYHNLPEKPDEWKPGAIDCAEVRNLSPEKAIVTGKLAVGCSDVDTWLDKAGVKVSVKATITAGIPKLGETKIEVGVEGSYEHDWGKSHIENKSWDLSVSVPVNSNKMVEITGKVMQGILTVPYTATFILEYSGSEEKIETQVQGEYKGVCAHKIDLQTSPEKSLNAIPIAQTNILAGVPANKPAADNVSEITMEPGSKVELLDDYFNKEVVHL